MNAVFFYPQRPTLPAIRLWMQEIIGFAIKQKSPGHQDSEETSQSSIVVSDSCQPGTAASTSFRGLPGLFLYYRLSEHKDNIASRLFVVSLTEHLQETLPQRLWNFRKRVEVLIGGLMMNQLTCGRKEVTRNE